MSYQDDFTQVKPVNPPGYLIDRIVESGSLSTVWLAKRVEDETDVAVKVISLKALTESTRNLINREFEILSKLDHPNIVKVFERMEYDDFTYLIMEYLPGGNLKTKVQEAKGLSEDEASEIYSSILKALLYLHEEVGVVHRDLKAENIMFDKNGTVKLIDFGFASFCHSGELLNEFCGSPRYTPPEILHGGEYGFPVDIWSLGVILYFMVSNEFPYDGNSPKDIAENIKYSQIDVKTEYTNDLKRLLLSIFVKTPKLRPTASKLMSFRWGVEHRESALLLKDLASCRGKLSSSDLDNFDIVGRLCASGRFSLANSRSDSSSNMTDNQNSLALNRAKSHDFQI